MIYFVQKPSVGAVKIGFTDDMATRLLQLEYKYRSPLAVLATMEGNRTREQEIHSRFAHLRFGKTEQFKPASDLMAFIGRPLLVGANPDAVEAMENHEKAVALTIKGSLEWRSWVESVAEHCRTDVAKVMDAAITDYAKKMGMPTPPPKR